MLSVAKLTRAPKSLANAMSIFFPIYVEHFDWRLALEYSLPVFFIVATGFIINDINDVDKDSINNKDSVLPQKEMSIQRALVLYYFFLAISLISIKLLIPNFQSFLYLFYLLLATNYDHIVRFKPSLKNLYVLLLALIHVTILHVLTSISILILASLVINVMCKEIFMDIRDLKGDGQTFVKVNGIKSATKLTYLLQIIFHSLVIVYVFLRATTLHIVILLVLLVLALIGLQIWNTFKNRYEIYMIRILAFQNFLNFMLIL